MNILTQYKEIISSFDNLNINEIEDEIGDSSMFVASKPNNKKLTLIINYFLYYLSNNMNEKLDTHNLGDLINLAASNNNVIVPYNPIYRYNQCSYSIEEQLVTIDEYKNIIDNNNIALYYIGIKNNIFSTDNSKNIYIRYNKIKK